MGKRFLILIGAAALGAALIAVGASANFRSVHDPRGDTGCFDTLRHHDPPCSDRTKRNHDIVRATAGHAGGRLRHTIRVVGKFDGGWLEISTDSDRTYEWFVKINRGRGRSGEVVNRDGYGTSRARIDFHRHSVEIVFSERSIGNPQSYGWRAVAWGSGRAKAVDRVPNRRKYIRHRLG